MLPPVYFFFCESTSEDPGCANVRATEGRQVVGSDTDRALRGQLEQAVCLAQPCAIKGIAYRTCIRKMRLLATQMNVLIHRLACVVIKPIIHRTDHFPGDLQKLGLPVVGEINVMGDA